MCELCDSGHVTTSVGLFLCECVIKKEVIDVRALFASGRIVQLLWLIEALLPACEMGL